MLKRSLNDIKKDINKLTVIILRCQDPIAFITSMKVPVVKIRSALNIILTFADVF